MALLTQAGFNYSFDDAVGEVMFQEYLEMDRMGPAIYRYKPSNAPQEVVATNGGPGLFQPKIIDTGTAEEGNLTQQFKTTLPHTPYAMVLGIGKEAKDDDRWGLAEKMGEYLGQSAADTEEYYAAALFNDAFTGASFTAEDGLSLFNNAHVNADGGNSQDNYLASTALTYANLKAARLAHRGILDYDGSRKLHINPNEIMAGLTLEEDVFQMVMTAAKPDTTDTNNLNFFARGGMRAYIWDWLDWTTQWCIMDSRLRSRNLLWYQRKSLELTADVSFTQGSRSIGGYMRFVNAVIGWQGFMGCAA